jgi:hypothetical protein
MNALDDDRLLTFEEATWFRSGTYCLLVRVAPTTPASQIYLEEGC